MLHFYHANFIILCVQLPALELNRLNILLAVCSFHSPRSLSLGIMVVPLDHSRNEVRKGQTSVLVQSLALASALASPSADL